MDKVVFSNIAYYGRFATVAVIAISGAACNAISLSFFLRHQRESLADKHLIFLNITDLLICFLSPAALFCLSELMEEGQDKSDLLHATVAESFLSLSLLSCFITTMLSVTRTMVLTKPLCIIRRNCVYLAHGLNTIFSLVFITCKIVIYHIQNEKRSENYSSVLLNNICHAIQFLYVLVTVGIVGVSSVIVVRALRRPLEIQAQQTGRQHNEANRKATVMILTLSIIFVILNGTWCVFWASWTIIEFSNNDRSGVNVILTWRLFAMFLSLFLMTINSFANPVVYMLRNSRLNNHTRSLLRRVKQFLTFLTTCSME